MAIDAPASRSSTAFMIFVPYLLQIAKLLAEDAAMIRNTDRYAWASCYLQDMSKAVIDDVVKVLEAPGSHGA